MTFPQTPLPIAVELFYDDVWNAIDPGLVYRRDGGISITRGRQNEDHSGILESRCTLVINNRDGRFSPRNPVGPLYGKITRNTPIRVTVTSADTLNTWERFTGEVSAWPQEWDTTGTDVWVPVQASG